MVARRRRIFLGVTILVLLQGAAVLTYLSVERRRQEPARSFGSERLDTREVAPSIDVERATGRPERIPAAPGKIVLIHFWATWCAPCREELPGLLSLGDKLRQSGRFELYAVSVDGDWSTVARYFDGQVPNAVVRARDPEAQARYGVSTLPDSYLLDREGRLAERFGGARDWRSSAAEKHLQEKIDE